MLNFEIADDPLYSGLEVQSFNDPRHGHGMVVLLTRWEDGRVDCYRQAGLAIDPAGYQIGGGLGEWIETTISPPHFEITDHGVDLDVCSTTQPTEPSRCESTIATLGGELRTRRLLRSVRPSSIRPP